MLCCLGQRSWFSVYGTNINSLELDGAFCRFLGKTEVFFLAFFFCFWISFCQHFVIKSENGDAYEK